MRGHGITDGGEQRIWVVSTPHGEICQMHWIERRLRRWQIDAGQGRCCLARTADIADDANDRQLRSLRMPADLLAHRVPSGKVRRGKAGVHDGDRHRVGSIGRFEPSAPQNRNAECSEIVGAHGLQVHFNRLLAFADEQAAAPSTSQRVPVREADSLDASQSARRGPTAARRSADAHRPSHTVILAVRSSSSGRGR